MSTFAPTIAPTAQASAGPVPVPSCSGTSVGATTNIDYASSAFDRRDLPRTFVGAFKEYRDQEKRPSAALRESVRFERVARTSFGVPDDVLVGRRSNGTVTVIVGFTEGHYGGYLADYLKECG